MPDKIKEVFDLISDKGYFTDEAEFRGYVSDPQRRKDAFELIKEDGYFTDENEFNSYFADETEKKKFKVEDFNKKYGTSYTESQFGVKKPSQSKSPSISITTKTTTTPQPKKIEVGESDLKLKEASLREQESLFKSYEPKIAELNAALQPYNELAKANGGALPPEEFAQYQQLYNESRKLSNEYKLAYNGYQQAFKDYKVGIDKYNEGIKVNQKETEAQKAKRLGEEKAKIEKLGKTNPLGRIKLYEQTISNINQKIPYLVEEYNKAEQAGDEAAMQQIELEIDKNQANIDYMTKAIQGQKKLGAIKQPDTIGNTLSTAIDMAAGTVYSGVNFLDEFMVSLSPFQLSDKAKKEIEELDAKSPIRRPSDVIAKAGKEILKEANKAEEERRVNMPYNGGVYAALKDGNLGDAISNAGHAFTVSLPTSLLMANPISGSMAAAGMAQENVDEKIAENGKATSTDYLVGGLKASTEYVFENMFGTGRQLKELVNQLGRDGASELVEQTLKGGLKDYFKKLGLNVTEESFGEGLTQLTQNAIDIADGKDIDLFEGVPDATLIGMFGGMTQGTVMTTASHYIDRAKLRSADEKRAKAQQLNEQAIEAESPAVAEAIEEKAVQLSEEADAEIEEQNEIGQNASPEIVEEIEVQNEKLDELEAAMEAAVESDDKDVAEAIGAKIEEVSAYVTTLVEQAKVEGLKKIKEQEDDTKGSVTTSSEGVSVTEPTIKDGEAKSKNEKAKKDSESVSKTREKDIKEVKAEAPAKEQEVVVKEVDAHLKLLRSKPTTRIQAEEIIKTVMGENNFKEAIRRASFLASGSLERHYNNDFSYFEDVANAIEKLQPKTQIVPLTDKVNNTEVVKEITTKVNLLEDLKIEEEEIDESDNTDTILEKAEKDNSPYRELAKAIKGLLGNVKTIVTNSFKSDVSTEADYGDNEIRINAKTKQNKLHLFFHEALHHVTREKISEFENNPNSKKLTSNEAQAIINLKRIFKQVSEKINKDEGGFGTQKGGQSANNIWVLDASGNKRGLANVHEFISEAFSNPEFQKILKEFKGEGKQPNLFKQFVDAVAEMLGLKDPSILNDIFYHTEELTKSQPIEDKAVTEDSSEDSGNNTKTEAQAVSEKGAEVKPKPKKARQESILYRGDKDLLGGKKDEWMKSPSKSLSYKATNKDKDALKKLLSDAATSGEMVKAYNEGRISAEDLWIIANDINSPSDVMKSIPAEILEKGREEEIYSTFPNKAYWKDKTEEIDLSKSYTDIKELEVGDLILTKSGGIGFVKKINPKKLIVETTYGGYSGSDYEIMDLSIDKNDVTQFKKPTESAKEKSTADKTIKALKNLKSDQKGKMNALGIVPAIWNAAIDTIILSIETGKGIANGIEKAIEYIREKHGEFDEAAFRKIVDEAGLEEAPKEVVKEEAKKEGEANRAKISKHFKTLDNNESLVELTKDLNQLDFEYQPVSMESDRYVAVKYLEENGVENTLELFLGENFKSKSGLTPSQQVQVAALLYSAMHQAKKQAIKDGDIALADAVHDKMMNLINKTRRLGTGLGQAVNAFKEFALDFSDPKTAVYNMQKHIDKINEERMNSSAVKKNSEDIAKDINETIKKGKRKTAQKVADILDEELYGQITKGSKGLNDSQKKKIKNIFDSFKVNPNGTAKSSVLPIKEIAAAIITPKLYNQVIDKVGDLVAEGVSLSVAMTRVSTEFIKNKVASPKEMAAARAALNRQVNGIKEKRPLTDKQKERKAESEKLKEATAEYNAEKEIADYKEKQQAKAESLREKDAKKVLEEVEKLELQRAQQQAKEAADLQAELAKERQRIADLKAKEATDLQDKIAKEELKRAQNKIKEIESAIKKLISEIPKTNEELAKELVDEYVGMSPTDKINNQKLIDLIKDKLDVDDAQAKRIATEIAKGIKDNVRRKLENRYASQLSSEERAAKAKAKSLTPKTNIIDELITASNTGVTPELIVSYLKDKYGIAELTSGDVDTILDIAKQVGEAPTKNRKGVLLGKIQELIDSKKKKTLAELFQHLFYARVLSPVLGIITGTGDVNIAYNLITTQLNALEFPITTGIMTTKYVKDAVIKGGSLKEVGDIVSGGFSDAIIGMSKSLLQEIVYDENDITNIDKFIGLLKNSKLMRQSINYFKTSIQEGTNFQKDYDNPFKATAGVKFDIANWNNIFKKAEAGDKSAQKRIAEAFGTTLNAYVNGVTNVLSGQDLFFGAIIGNAYSVPLTREKYYKEGFRGEELNKKVIEDVLSTKLEYENAKNEATSYRMKYDITIEEKVDSSGFISYAVRDKGKLKGTFLSREYADTFAKEVVAPSGNTFNNDVIYLLNQKMGDYVYDHSNRIARNDLLSGGVEGGTGKILHGLATTFIQGLNKLSDSYSETAKSLDQYNWADIASMSKGLDPMALKAVVKKALSAVIEGISIIVRAFSNLLAFIRVGLNSIRNQSSYIPPIGVWRYLMSFGEKDEKTKTIAGLMSYKISDVERSKILSKAIVGSIMTLLSSTLLSFVKDAMSRGDDDDDEKVKEMKQQKDASIIKFKEWYKGVTGKDINKKIETFYSKLYEGQVIGNLSWMPPNEKMFYQRTGLLVENSKFMGYDEDGKPKFESVKNRPDQALNLILSTYQLVEAFGDEKDKAQSYIYASLTPLYSWKDMSIGQGGVSVMFGNMSAEEKAKKLAQIAILDNFEVFNPSLIRVGLQYYDQKMRRNKTLFDAIEEEGTFYGGVKSWMVNRVMPIYGAYNQAMNAEQVYGMFGEDLYRIPAESQGVFSSKLAEYVKSGKNQEEQKMYMWLDVNGYSKVWIPNKEEPIYGKDGVPNKLTKSQINKYGAIAGKKTKKEIEEKLAKLQDIRDNKGETEEDRVKSFTREIDGIFRRNFKNAYYEGENTFGSQTKDIISSMDKSYNDKFNQKIDKYNEDKKTDVIVDRALNVTPEEQKLRQSIMEVSNENKFAYIVTQTNKLKTKPEQSTFLQRLWIIDAITTDTYLEVKESLGIE